MRWWTILLAVLLVITPPVIVPATPRSCGSCHEMKAYYQSWKRSTHGQVGISCDKCHVKPGLAPFVKYRLNSYRELYTRVSGQEVKPYGLSPASTEACRRCHSLNRVRSTSGDLKINHRIHVLKAKLGCPTCHNGAVHPGVKGLGGLNPPRKQCVKCHRAQMKNCSYCHVIRGKFPGEFKHDQGSAGYALGAYYYPPMHRE